jgi:[protein-PII] uridylyltransferase
VLAHADLRDRLQCRRSEIAALHAGGAPGFEVSAALVSLWDEVVGRLYTRSVEGVPDSERSVVLESLSLVAVGGYGRGDLAPYSDVDLLFLTAPNAPQCVRGLVSQLVRDLWDVGLHLSQSVRSPAECIAFAKSEFAARTALFETRLLAGDPELAAELRTRFQRLVASMSIRKFADEALAERAKEHEDYYSQTVCLLEPNVKKSPGGLRDLHLFRWLTLARDGIADAGPLRSAGIDPEDAELLGGAGEFLRRIRHELHYRADAAQDVLTREEQLRLAEWMGFQQEASLLPVERFMQHYYRQTLGVHDLLMRTIDRIREGSGFRSLLSRITTYKAAEYILLNRDRVSIDRRAPDGFLLQADNLVHLFDLVRGYGVPVAHATLARIRAKCPDCRVTPAARARFLQCLANPRGLGDFLRYLHRVGLLERLLPPFQHARCLIQFNLLHHYTIDEHCIRAVEAAVRRSDDRGPLGMAYREIRRKDLLHLALLLHDLGKGLGQDHCEVGGRLAEEAAGQLGLPEHDRQLLVFLVHRHLLMAYTALRRDFNDVQTLLQFTRTVATPEVLRMLFVLTAADTEAVAPGEFSAWKESLLTDLYFRAMEELTGEAPVADEDQRADAIRGELQHALADRFDPAWLKEQLEPMPLSYLVNTEPQRVEEHLRALREDPSDGVRVTSDYLRDVELTRYTVFTHDDLTPGLFSKIAGVLASAGFQIIDAQIVTRSDGVVLDTFRGMDLDFTGEPPSERMQEISDRIQAVLLGRQTVEALMARRGQPLNHGRKPGPHDPPQVEIDNESSDRFTIVEVFAEDRLGLLYAITRTLFDLGLSVYSAKISTHYDQIVDAFYVTTRDGQKLTDAAHLDTVQRRLLDAIGPVAV